LGSCRTITSALAVCSAENSADDIGTEPAAPIVPSRVTGTPSTTSSVVRREVPNARTRLSRRPRATLHSD
jgi:hypothetical protein